MKKLIFIFIFLSTYFNSLSSVFPVKDTSNNHPEDTIYKKVFIKRDHSECFKPFLRIYLGSFHARSTTSVTINSSTLGAGTTFDPEKVLGDDERNFLPRAEVIVYPGKRHEIDLFAWSSRRDATHTLDKTIQYDDKVFNVNTSVTSKFNYSMYSGTYRFSFLNSPCARAGISVGGKFLDFNSEITANLNGHSYSAEKRVYAPIPLAGIHGTYNYGKHITLRGTAEYFKLNLNDYRFQTIDLRGGIEYYIVENVGLGADYHYFNTRLEKVPSDKLNGEIKYRWNAVSLFLAIIF